MNRPEILAILDRTKAIITDSHIVYTSGKHGSAYVNKDAIYPHTKATVELCCEIADRFKGDDVETVIAPAIGGVILSQWVAHRLSELTHNYNQVFGIYAEKSSDGSSFIVTRGYDKFVTDKKVLVIDDILTTGGSARKVVEVVRSIGGNVVGVGALCNRGGVTTENLANVPRLASLVDINLESYDEENCPLCKQGVPINTDVGKGREYLARKARNP